MRQRKRDQLHIFRRTLIGEEPLSFQGHFPIFVKSAPQITSLISTGQRTDPNEGQLHSFFPPTIFKASQCGRRLSKYQSYKACGHLGRRRSTSMDKRRRGGGQGRVRTQWLSEVSASVAHCTAPSSSPPGHGKFISCCRLEIKELSRPPLFILLMRLDVESKSAHTLKKI